MLTQLLDPIIVCIVAHNKSVLIMCGDHVGKPIDNTEFRERNSLVLSCKVTHQLVWTHTTGVSTAESRNTAPPSGNGECNTNAGPHSKGGLA